MDYEKEKAQIIKIRNEGRDITDSTEIKFIRRIGEQFTNKLNN